MGFKYQRIHGKEIWHFGFDNFNVVYFIYAGNDHNIHAENGT